MAHQVTPWFPYEPGATDLDPGGHLERTRQRVRSLTGDEGFGTLDVNLDFPPVHYNRIAKNLGGLLHPPDFPMFNSNQPLIHEDKETPEEPSQTTKSNASPAFENSDRSPGGNALCHCSICTICKESSHATRDDVNQVHQQVADANTRSGMSNAIVDLDRNNRFLGQRENATRQPKGSQSPQPATLLINQRNGLPAASRSSPQTVLGKRERATKHVGISCIGNDEKSTVIYSPNPRDFHEPAYDVNVREEAAREQAAREEVERRKKLRTTPQLPSGGCIPPLLKLPNGKDLPSESVSLAICEERPKRRVQSKGVHSEGSSLGSLSTVPVQGSSSTIPTTQAPESNGITQTAPPNDHFSNIPFTCPNGNPVPRPSYVPTAQAPESNSITQTAPPTGHPSSMPVTHLNNQPVSRASTRNITANGNHLNAHSVPGGTSQSLMVNGMGINDGSTAIRSPSFASENPMPGVSPRIPGAHDNAIPARDLTPVSFYTPTGQPHMASTNGSAVAPSHSSSNGYPALRASSQSSRANRNVNMAGNLPPVANHALTHGHPLSPMTNGNINMPRDPTHSPSPRYYPVPESNGHPQIGPSLRYEASMTRPVTNGNISMPWDPTRLPSPRYHPVPDSNGHPQVGSSNRYEDSVTRVMHPRCNSSDKSQK
ncbi:hypothetical protein ACLMJK_000329 [Lecanora helva]